MKFTFVVMFPGQPRGGVAAGRVAGAVRAARGRGAAPGRRRRARAAHAHVAPRAPRAPPPPPPPPATDDNFVNTIHPRGFPTRPERAHLKPRLVCEFHYIAVFVRSTEFINPQ